MVLVYHNRLPRVTLVSMASNQSTAWANGTGNDFTIVPNGLVTNKALFVSVYPDWGRYRSAAAECDCESPFSISIDVTHGRSRPSATRTTPQHSPSARDNVGTPRATPASPSMPGPGLCHPRRSQFLRSPLPRRSRKLSGQIPSEDHSGRRGLENEQRRENLGLVQKT